jgi:hypothetical protein
MMGELNDAAAQMACRSVVDGYWLDPGASRSDARNVKRCRTLSERKMEEKKRSTRCSTMY